MRKINNLKGNRCFKYFHTPTLSVLLVRGRIFLENNLFITFSIDSFVLCIEASNHLSLSLPIPLSLFPYLPSPPLSPYIPLSLPLSSIFLLSFPFPSFLFSLYHFLPSLLHFSILNTSNCSNFLH